ncbi:unnamed protein product, partial [Rotaria magnacalcarata]
YGRIQPHVDSINLATSRITLSPYMESNSFVNLNQSTALKELPKFTGDPQQKVTQFIDGVERIGTFTESNESLFNSIATIKLGGAVFN